MTNPQPEQALSTTAGFRVNLSALAAHQQQLDVVVDQLAEALRAALDTHLPEEAFGPFGAPLAAAIKPTAATAQAAFERAVDSVGVDRDGVLHTVRLYDGLEQANTGMFRTLTEAE